MKGEVVVMQFYKMDNGDVIAVGDKAVVAFESYLNSVDYIEYRYGGKLELPFAIKNVWELLQ